MRTRMPPSRSTSFPPSSPPDGRYRQLRRCALEDGLRLLHFSLADQDALAAYLGNGLPPGPTWLSRLALRRAVPLALLKRARPVPPALALTLAPTPDGTRDIYIEGCVLRIVAGSQALVDVLRPRHGAFAPR